MRDIVREDRERDQTRRVEQKHHLALALWAFFQGVLLSAFTFWFLGFPASQSVSYMKRERDTHTYIHQINEIAVSKAVFNFQCSFSLLTFDI
jgi:hypothetical protein